MAKFCPCQIQEVVIDCACNWDWGKRIEFLILVGKSLEMRAFGILRKAWEGDIKTHLKGTNYELINDSSTNLERQKT
jgi:hypothetical protein